MLPNDEISASQANGHILSPKRQSSEELLEVLNTIQLSYTIVSEAQLPEMCAVGQIENYSSSRGETKLLDSATVSPTKTGLKENKTVISTDESKEPLVSNVSPKAKQAADAVPQSSEEMANAAET